jgi:hypothetical protein
MRACLRELARSAIDVHRPSARSDLQGASLFRVTHSEHTRRNVELAGEGRLSGRSLANLDIDLNSRRRDDLIRLGPAEVDVLGMEHLDGQSA